MPQMSPLNWLTLFFMFLMIFLIFNSMNYFSFLYNSSKKNNYCKKKVLNWKW